MNIFIVIYMILRDLILNICKSSIVESIVKDNMKDTLTVYILRKLLDIIQWRDAN